VKQLVQRVLPSSRVGTSKIASQLGLTMAANIAFQLVGYLILMRLARTLPRAELGQFLLLTSLASLASLFTELGVNPWLTRQIAQQPEQARWWFPQVISLRLSLAVLYMLLFNGGIAAWRPDLVIAALLLSGHVFLEQLYFSFGAIFFAVGRARANVVAGAIGKGAMVVLVYGATAIDAGLHAIAFCHILSSVLLITVASTIARQLGYRLHLSGNLENFRLILQHSLPFFGLTALSMIQASTGLALLGVLQPYGTVASYGMANKLLEAARFLARPLQLVLLPVSARLASTGRRRTLYLLLRNALIIASALGFIIAVSFVVRAETIVQLLFGEGYGDAARVARVLLLSLPMMYLSTISMLLATAMQLEQIMFKLVAGCLTINVLVALTVIPHWGGLGAAWATSLSEGLLAFLTTVVVLRQLQTRGMNEVAQGYETTL
jgi:O-antigen/teichoic acid export membrane protein